jgi:1,4-alpha-glucan branching enzyme
MIDVTFVYHTGLTRQLSTSARLTGSWNANGDPSDSWTSIPMVATRDEAGCPAFKATVSFPDRWVGTTFRWGVTFDGPGGSQIWAVPTEVQSSDSQERTRRFELGRQNQVEQVEEYFLTYSRRLGANKLLVPGSPEPGIRFAVWAPNARAVELVFGDLAIGYIADQPDPSLNGIGATSAPGAFPLRKEGTSGVWSTDSRTHPSLGTFAARDHGPPYMFKVMRDDGSVAYRTDLYSRCQIGSGKTDPQGQPYTGVPTLLDGTKSCSVVVDPERVMRDFDEPFPQTNWLEAEQFWADEFDPARPVPTELEDLVIYELHVPGLGAGGALPGSLGDAIQLLDHLVELGVTAVELMPMAEAEGWASWGYGTSHYFAVEYVSGGRDQFKHFIKECHKRGLAVILDVVYNHYGINSERAQWEYDSPDPTRNIYYWYEGRPEDYPDFQRAVEPERRNDGGYVSNESSGWAPRYWEEHVRHLFISSAVVLAEEFHVDGFRVDQTTSIHAYPHLVADGRPAQSARIFGAKFLREWTRTLRLIKPTVFLFAEDHSEWSGVIEPTERGGLGFDAAWYANF